ncbi:hypothetical protein MTR67_005719 [Solanum verrucosum]|uniref:COX assembly mitochondrial protein n=1 Tax=Solanum verrucosum TaxID=315347 RepID=A0AAF0Q2P2_SOLVR|nr:hypothetical protein MTR67_005719 [Solanum verrucosum]
MHPPLTLHRHPLCADIIEEFQKCHTDHPLGKFLGQCTELKVKLDRCFRQEVRFLALPIRKLYGFENISSVFLMYEPLKKYDVLLQKAIKRKANFEQSKKLKERLQAYRKETADMQS